MAAPQPSEKCARSDRDMNLQRIDRKLDAYVIVGHIHTLFLCIVNEKIHRERLLSFTTSIFIKTAVKILLKYKNLYMETLHR